VHLTDLCVLLEIHAVKDFSVHGRAQYFVGSIEHDPEYLVVVGAFPRAMVVVRGVQSDVSDPTKGSASFVMSAVFGSAR
jgi:hypothetical protein